MVGDQHVWTSDVRYQLSVSGRTFCSFCCLDPEWSNGGGAFSSLLRNQLRCRRKTPSLLLMKIQKKLGDSLVNDS